MLSIWIKICCTSTFFFVLAAIATKIAMTPPRNKQSEDFWVGVATIAFIIGVVSAVGIIWSVAL